jgi:esterase
VKLYYRKSGQGPYLIILHGLFGSSDNWLTIARKLENHFTVILPDQRNHGRSPHSGEHDYEKMRDDLHELVSELKPDKFFLAGHSMGGKTAMFFAVKWPELISGLLIADISPFRTGNSDHPEYDQHYRILQAILDLDLSTIRSRSEAEKKLFPLLGSPAIIQFILKNLQRSADHGFEWKLNAGALIKNLDKIMQGFDQERANYFRVTGFPVIFLKGSRSDYLPEEHYNDILKIFPAAEFKVIKNAGHWLHAENPEEVTESFLKLLM